MNRIQGRITLEKLGGIICFNQGSPKFQNLGGFTYRQTWDWPENKKPENIFWRKTPLLLIKASGQSNFKQHLSLLFHQLYILHSHLFLTPFLILTPRIFYYFWSSAMHWAAKFIRGHAFPKKIFFLRQTISKRGG